LTGESEYNVLGLLGGDSGISTQGHKYAEILPDVIFDRLPLSFDDSGCPPVRRLGLTPPVCDS
jgi:hypothetical protein